jgi:hypothetical protein
MSKDGSKSDRMVSADGHTKSIRFYDVTNLFRKLKVKHEKSKTYMHTGKGI